MAKPYLRAGVWYSNFRAQGRRIRKALSPNKRTAQALLDELVSVYRAQKIGIAPQNVRWSTFQEKYLDYGISDKKHNTQNKDRQAFALMHDHATIKYLSDVTPDLLETLKTRWKKAGVKPSILTRSVKAIKTAMRKAEEWKMSPPQNWRVVRVVEPKARLIYWTVPELERLIKRAAGIYKTTIIIMARAGLRSGEVYHLETSDLHFDLRKIHIIWKPCANHCQGCEAGQWIPKGRKERWVPMSPDLYAYLKALRPAPGHLLGADRPSLTYYLMILGRLIRAAGLRGTPHTLRHTFASHAVSGGASLAAIGEILGHTNPATTQIYAHLMPHASQDAIARLPVVRL